MGSEMCIRDRIQLLITSNDVMHSFFLPSAVVQIYGINGRINEAWMQIDKEGWVYGQCNQICGINHAYMPIEVRALPRVEYDAWLSSARVEFAMNDSFDEPETLKLASAN